MTTIEKIQSLLAQNKISVYKLSKEIGLNKTFLTNWTSGKAKPSADALSKIADYFHVSVDYLLGRTDNPVFSSGEKLVDYVAFHGGDYELSENEMYKFQVVGTIAAGFDGNAQEEYTGEDLIVPPHLIKTRNPDDYFVLEVKGDSMFPLLENGDKVLIKKCSTVDSGTVAAVGFNGEQATVKKVEYIQGEDWIRLIPRNPEYPVKTIRGSDLDQCRIYGEVVYLFRDKINF